MYVPTYIHIRTYTDGTVFADQELMISNTIIHRDASTTRLLFWWSSRRNVRIYIYIYTYVRR